MTDREHFELLAAELGVDVEYVAPRFGAAVNTALRVAYVEPFEADEDDQAYSANLHELGHVAAPQTGVRRWEQNLAETLWDEARAWLWAIERYRRPLTGELLVATAGGIGSYLRSGAFPDEPGADSVRALLGLLGEVELPWPKTNAALQMGRAAYLQGVTA